MLPHERLRQMRERAGLSQNALAIEIDRTHTYIWSVENGRVKLTARDTIEAWAKALNVSTDEIYYALGMAPHDIIDLVSDASPDSWELVRRILREFNAIDAE